MAVTSIPRISEQLLAANGLIAPFPYTILIVGQTGTNGTTTTAVGVSGVESMTVSQITGLFGTKSELTNRILRLRANLQGQVPIWVMPIAPVAGQAAAGYFNIIRNSNSGR